MIIYQEDLNQCNNAPDYFNSNGNNQIPALLGILSYGRESGSGSSTFKLIENNDNVIKNVTTPLVTTKGYSLSLVESEEN